MEKGQDGFTLLEVLLVLFLMMAIVAISVPRFNTAEGITTSKADSANRVLIEGAIELYRLDTGMFPKEMKDLYLPPPGVRGWRGPYLDQVILKPTRGEESYKLDERGRVLP
jgi:general secretion pathway protein G